MSQPRTYIDIKSKPCKHCEVPIGFVKSKKGKWMCVDVFILDGKEVTYYHSKGLYPLHKCAHKNVQSNIVEGKTT